MSQNIVVDTDIFDVQSLILTFNPTAFWITMAAFAVILVGILVLHGLILVPRHRLKGYDFRTQTKREFGNIFRFLYLTFRAFADLALSLSSRIPFIRIYGIDVLNFLNWETKFFLCLAAQCVVVLAVAIGYQLFVSPTFSVFSFLVGEYPFSNFCGFYTFFAVTFNLLLRLTTQTLFRQAKDFHLTFFLENKDLTSRYSLLANVCYLSKINRQAKKADLEKELTQLLGIYPSDFILVLFPKVQKICDIQREMDYLTDVWEYHRVQSGWWFSLFYNKKKEEQLYKDRMAKLRYQYDEERKKPLKFNGRGMIFFYRIGDVETFYHLNKEFTARSRLELQDAAQPLLRGKNVVAWDRIRKTFLLSYNELIIRNLDIRTSVNTVFRVALYTLLFLLMTFISTPNTLIQNLINAIVGSFGDQAEAIQFFRRKDIQVFLSLIFPLITTLFNLVLIITIEQLGQFQKLTRHSSYQSYMIRFAFLYLLVNMFVIPGFSLGTSSSLFSMFVTERFSPLKMLLNIRLEEKGQYFATFIVQASVSSFICYIPILKEIAFNRFSYDLLFKHLKEVRRKAYRKVEADLFEFGYNYSHDLVMIYIVAGFGIFQPLLFFCGAAFFLIKGISMVNAHLSFYKGQSYAETKYLDMALNRVRFASMVGLLFVAVKCYIANHWNLFLFAAAMTVVSGTDAALHRGSSFGVHELFEPTYQIKLGMT